MEHISGLLIGQLTQGHASDWLTLRTPLIMVSSSHKYGNVTWLDLVTDMFYSCNGQNTGGWWILQCHFVQSEQLMQAVLTLGSHSLNIGLSSGYIRAGLGSGQGWQTGSRQRLHEQHQFRVLAILKQKYEMKGWFLMSSKKGTSTSWKCIEQNW